LPWATAEDDVAQWLNERQELSPFIRELAETVATTHRYKIEETQDSEVIANFPDIIAKSAVDALRQISADGWWRLLPIVETEGDWAYFQNPTDREWILSATVVR
jgi:hypothetical protein